MEMEGAGKCGYPVFVNSQQCDKLNITIDPLSGCIYEGFYIFAFIIGFILAVFIVVGNALLPLSVWWEKSMRSHHNYIKVSLSFADMIIGFITLSTVLPNMVWIRQATKLDLEIQMNYSRNTAKELFGGAFVGLTWMAHMNHLVILSFDRLIAVKWPMFYLNSSQNIRTTQITVLVVWLISIALAFFPMLSSRETTVHYFSPVTLTYLYIVANASGWVYLSFTLVIPYILTITSSFITAYVLHQKFKVQRTRRSVQPTESGSVAKNGSSAQNVRRKRKNKLKSDLYVVQTIGIMIAAFHLYLVPQVLYIVLKLNKVFDCSNSAWPETLEYILGFLSSFANVIIYLFRDHRFRQVLLNLPKRAHIDSGQSSD